MNPFREIELALKRLKAVGTVERATKEKLYLKSDLRFLGVTVPRVRLDARGFTRDHAPLSASTLRSLCEDAWSREIYELRSWSVFVLERQTDVLSEPDLKWIEGLIDQAKTWALVDELATRVTAPLFARLPLPQGILHRWAKSEDFWLRRTALLTLLPSLRQGGGDFALFEALSAPMLEEKEFFIRKAIGWVLREVSKRRPRLTYDYLRAHRESVSGLSLREGAKYLSPTQRTSLGLPKAVGKLL